MKTKVGRLHCVQGHRVRVIFTSKRQGVFVVGEAWEGWVRRADLRAFRKWNFRKW